MRKIASLALAALCLIACSKEDPVQEKVSYTVVEEFEISAGELLSDAVSSLQGDEYKQIVSDLSEAWNTAVEELQSANGSDESNCLFKIARINYSTKDEAGKDVTVSSLLIYPRLGVIDKVMLVNHGTHIGNMMVPSYYTAVEMIISANGGLCMFPDYIGVGASSSHKDLYLNAEVHGTTSTDALLVALKYAEDKDLYLDEDFDTYVMGYSQGGSVSLATLRQIQRLSDEEQEKLHLKKVICGDGPYDLRQTFDTYVEDEEEGKPMGLPSVIPNVINSMFNSYPDLLAEWKYKDFFTDYAWETGVPQSIADNTVSALDMVLTFKGDYLSDILNMDFIEKNPKAYEDLLSCMDRQNLCNGNDLSANWMPEYPLHFIHCNPDGVVPYSNFENAEEGLWNLYVTSETHDASALNSKPLLQHCYGMAVMFINALAGKYY